jgi:beta-glucosidase
VAASFTVTNTGDRRGADVPQLYLTDAAGEPRTRLLGLGRVELDPGESHQLSVTADPRLLARYDGNAASWHIAGGRYRVALGNAADTLAISTAASLDEWRLGS